MNEFTNHLDPAEQQLQQQVLAAAEKAGILPWHNCVVGQPGRLWPLAVLIEMNLQRLRKGFSPLPVRSADGEEFFTPWSYAALGATNEMELATLFETLASRLERADEDMDEDDDDLFEDYEDSVDEEEIMLPALELNCCDDDEDEDTADADHLSDRELCAAAKADAELERFNLILKEQMDWIRGYPNEEQRVDFYKTLAHFLGQIADKLDDLY